MAHGVQLTKPSPVDAALGMAWNQMGREAIWGVDGKATEVGMRRIFKEL